MTPAIVYYIKVNIALLLFYAFYRLFFYKDTFFHLRRLSLVSFFLLALLYPLLNIQEWIQGKEPITEVVAMYSAILPEVIISSTEATPNGWGIPFSSFLTGIYLSGVLFLGLRFLIRLGSLIHLAAHAQVSYLDTHTIYIPKKESPPFSFFHFIFLTPYRHSETELQEILEHEYTHVRQWHSLDVIVSELMSVLCWINPCIWLLRKEVHYNLEYLADHTVLEKGFDHTAYQYHLVGLAHQQAGVGLYNSFSMLHLKNRILMMNKKRTHGFSRTKYILFIPLIIALLISSNIEVMGRITYELTRNAREKTVLPGLFSTEENQTYLSGIYETIHALKNNIPSMAGSFPEETIRPPQLPAHEIERDEKVYTLVDKMPEFPGGEDALLKFINQNIRYPQEAQRNGMQGRVICSFVVTSRGKLKDIEVVRGTHRILDQEAAQVIELMPEWTPGTLKGKPVAVKYTIPITFKLQKPV